MLPLKTILCPIDFSAPSLTALNTAVRWALHFDARLHVLHVIPSLTPDLIIGFSNTLPSGEQRRTLALEALEKIRQCHIPDSIRVVNEVRMGETAAEIVYAAQDEQVDLLILATHGHTGWKHFVLGSVAEQVVRKAQCPVLTVQCSKAEPVAEMAVLESVRGGVS